MDTNWHEKGSPSEGVESSVFGIQYLEGKKVAEQGHFNRGYLGHRWARRGTAREHG
jgi:hypothetical protein